MFMNWGLYLVLEGTQCKNMNNLSAEMGALIGQLEKGKLKFHLSYWKKYHKDVWIWTQVYRSNGAETETDGEYFYLGKLLAKLPAIVTQNNAWGRDNTELRHPRWVTQQVLCWEVSGWLEGEQMMLQRTALSGAHNLAKRDCRGQRERSKWRQDKNTQGNQIK